MSGGEYIMSGVDLLMSLDTIEGLVFCSSEQQGIKLFTTFRELTDFGGKMSQRENITVFGGKIFKCKTITVFGGKPTIFREISEKQHIYSYITIFV